MPKKLLFHRKFLTKFAKMTSQNWSNGVNSCMRGGGGGGGSGNDSLWQMQSQHCFRPSKATQ